MTTREGPRPPLERVPLPEEDAPTALVARVRAHLAAGELVAFPTETVYGIAARADDPVALRRLRERKGRGAERALTWHVGSRDVLARFATLRPLAARLAERYWPGPLTLVLKGVPAGLEHAARDGWTGVRLPAHRGTASLLAALDFPVVGTSANASGGAPATVADQVTAAFPEGLALLLDGGPCRLAEASGVLRVGPGRFELLREGLLPVDDLRRTAGRRIAFVCTGNTCRSPMAEGLARRALAERLGVAAGSRALDGSATRIEDFGFEVLSMGVFAASGQPAAEHAIAVLAEQGLHIGAHRSRPATPEAVAAMDEIYGLTHSHVEALRGQLPPAQSEKVQLLDPAGADVPDPIGGSRADYLDARDAIARSIRARLDRWA